MVSRFVYFCGIISFYNLFNFYGKCWWFEWMSIEKKLLFSGEIWKVNIGLSFLYLEMAKLFCLLVKFGQINFVSWEFIHNSTHILMFMIYFILRRFWNNLIIKVPLIFKTSKLFCFLIKLVQSHFEMKRFNTRLRTIGFEPNFYNNYEWKIPQFTIIKLISNYTR